MRACLFVGASLLRRCAAGSPLPWQSVALAARGAPYTVERPLNRRMLTVLGSADSTASARYGAVVGSLFERLRSTSALSLLSGGCSGLMGASRAFCAKGALGDMCNCYDGFCRNPSGCEKLRAFCETRHFIKFHYVGDPIQEEQILTGGMTAGVADGFLLLPGGVGTTREAFDVLQANFEYGNVNKPLFCLNVSDGDRGFYEGIFRWIKQLYGDRLARPYAGSNGSSVFVSGSSTELAAAIDEWASAGTLPEHLRLERLLNVTALGSARPVLV